MEKPEKERIFTPEEQEVIDRAIKRRLRREKQKIADLKYYIAYLEARLQENKGSDKR